MLFVHIRAPKQAKIVWSPALSVSHRSCCRPVSSPGFGENVPENILVYLSTSKHKNAVVETRAFRTAEGTRPSGGRGPAQQRDGSQPASFFPAPRTIPLPINLHSMRRLYLGLDEGKGRGPLFIATSLFGRQGLDPPKHRQERLCRTREANHRVTGKSRKIMSCLREFLGRNFSLSQADPKAQMTVGRERV